MPHPHAAAQAPAHAPAHPTGKRVADALALGLTRACEHARLALVNQAAQAVKAHDRDRLRDGEAALSRQSGDLASAFRSALADAVPALFGDPQATVPAEPPPPHHEPMDWEALTLVDDAEIERDLARSRLVQGLASRAEWELRELDGLLTSTGVAPPEGWAAAIGQALHRAAAEPPCGTAIGDAGRDALFLAFSNTLADALRPVLVDLKAQGLRATRRALTDGPRTTGHDGRGDTRDAPLKEAADTRSSAWRTSTRAADDLGGPGGFVRTGAGVGAGPTGRGSGHSELAATARGGGWSGGGAGPASTPETAGPGGSDSQLRSLLQRLHALSEGLAALPSGGSTQTAGEAFAPALPPANLIRRHQAELARAAPGALDPLVIELVGTLFDHVLADPRVPPQMARQIARLQLPVLRVTLVDPTFFSNRRHPVRLFVNRMATLACAHDAWDEGPGAVLLQRVTQLVQEIVDGDFERIDVYARQLHALEAEAARAALESVSARTGPQGRSVPAMVAREEARLQVQQRYQAQLHDALQPLALPPFLGEFLTQVWSQALVAARQPGEDAALAQRRQAAARDLVMSVQPKGSPTHRQRFLVSLPGLIREVQAGVQRIGWPDAAWQRFLDQLRPEHARALRGAPLSELDHNLLARRLDSVFGAPLPTAGERPTGSADDTPAAPVAFAADEAAALGYMTEPPEDVASATTATLPMTLPVPLTESAPDTAARPDTAPGASAIGDADTVPDPLLPLAREAGLPVSAPAAVGASITGPAASDPAGRREPLGGPALARQLRPGFGYQMWLKSRWEKVLLAHVSDGQGFYVFTWGRGQRETLTMTARMLAGLCASGRFKALESAFLIERASERAREQLARLRASVATPAAAPVAAPGPQAGGEAGFAPTQPLVA